jgi:hypothetical protein
MWIGYPYLSTSRSIISCLFYFFVVNVLPLKLEDDIHIGFIFVSRTLNRQLLLSTSFYCAYKSFPATITRLPSGSL